MAIRQIDGGWAIETSSAAYAFGLNTGGALTHRYWGARLPDADDYPPATPPGIWASFNGPGQLVPEEYPAWAGLSYVEPCLKVSFADGVRDAVLRCRSVEPVDGAELCVRLVDERYPLAVDLHYRSHEPYDLVERWAVITNLGAEPVRLERAWSALWHLPPDGRYRLSHLSGRWLDEMHLHREFLLPGTKVLESRRLTTSHHASQ